MRTDSEAVKGVIDTSLEPNEIDTYIIQSNRMVTRVLGGSTLTEEQLTDIETWLAAHLIAISKERQPQEEKVGDIWLKFNKNPEGFLTSTTYGQMVLFLDTTGEFQKASKMRASIRAIPQVDPNE